MFSRRLIIAMPALWAIPAAAQPVVVQPAPAQHGEALAAALVVCWQARGVRFTPAQVQARIGGRTGKAALLAVAGATESADGDGEETAVEIAWEAGAPASPTLPLLVADLARGLPALLITHDGRALLLHALGGASADASDPLSGQRLRLLLSEAALIGRPVIAGA